MSWSAEMKKAKVIPEQRVTMGFFKYLVKESVISFLNVSEWTEQPLTASRKQQNINKHKHVASSAFLLKCHLCCNFAVAMFKIYYTLRLQCGTDFLRIDTTRLGFLLTSRHIYLPLHYAQEMVGALMKPRQSMVCGSDLKWLCFTLYCTVWILCTGFEISSCRLWIKFQTDF